MYARVIKNGKEVWSSEYVVSVYEDKMKGNTIEKFITFDCRICECPPHYETRSFLDRDYDEVIMKKYYSYEDYENDKEAALAKE